jgi:hypothetical protein
VHPRDGLNDFAAQWGGDDLQWLSRYDGLRALRITNLGSYCFGCTPDFKPTQPNSSLELTVLPNLSIRLRSGTPLAAEKFLLQTWAEPVATDVWQLEPTRAREAVARLPAWDLCGRLLEPTRAREAVERGQSAGDFATFLQRCDNQPLPETVRGFLKTCEDDGKALRSCGEASLFECRDANTCAMICAQPQLQNRCLRCGETQLAVPAAHLETFRKVVRSLGLGVS